MASKAGFKHRNCFSYLGSALQFVDDRTVLHAAGNVLCAPVRLPVPTLHAGKLDIGDASQELFLVGNGVGIGVFAANLRKNVIAFVEKGMHPHVRFADLETGSGLSTLSDGADLEFNDLAFSDDGNLLATLGGVPDFELLVWDWGKGHVLGRTTLPVAGSNVSFNPNTPDEICVSGDPSPPTEGHMTRAGKGSLFFVRLLQDQDGVITIDFHKATSIGDEKVDWQAHVWDNDNHVFCGSSSGQIWKFDPATGNTMGSVFHVSSGASVKWLRVTNTHLIVAAEDATLRWFDLEESEECYKVQVPQESSASMATTQQLVSAALSPTGQSTLLGCSSGGMFNVTLQGQIPALTEEGTPEVIEVSKDDLTGTPGQVQSDSVATLNKVVDFPTGPVTSMAAIKDSEVAVVGADCYLRVFNLASGALLARRRFTRPLTTVATVPNTRYLVLGDNTGLVRVVELPPLTGADSNKPKVVKRLRLHKSAVLQICTHGGGEWAASVAKEGKVFFIEITPGAEPWARGFNVAGYMDVGAEVDDAAFVPATPGVHPQLFLSTTSLTLLRISPPEPGTTLTHLEITPEIAAAGVAKIDRRICCLIPLDATRLYHTAVDSKTLGVTSLPAALGELSEVEAAPPVHTVVELNNHHKDGVAAIRSDNAQFVVTVGRDGLVLLYDISVGQPAKGARPKSMTRVFDGFLGGCTSAVFAADGVHVAVGGSEGGVMALGVGMGRGTAKDSGGSEPESWNPRDDESDDEDDDSAPTFLEERFRELREVQEAVHMAVKNKTRGAVGALRDKLQAALAHNNEVNELERLERFEMIVDLEAKEEMENEGKARVEAVQENIRLQNLGRQLIWDRIKGEVWDSMEQIGFTVVSFEETANTRVTSFPIQHERQLNVIKLLRRIEVAESSLLRGLSQPTSATGALLSNPTKNKAWGPPLEEGLPRLQQTKTATVAGKDAVAAGGEGGEGGGEEVEEEVGEAERDLVEVQGEGRGENAALIPHRLDVCTRERRIAQAALVRREGDAIKRAFNDLLKQALERKREVVSKVAEKNSRIQEILEELKSSETTKQPGLVPEEEPLRVLTVEDDEVTVERFDQEDIADKENKREVDAEAEAAAQRALKTMMGGTLDSDKAVHKLEQVIARPDWLDLVDPDDITEEQARAIKELHAAEKALAEEKDKYRKALESEAKKLRAEQGQLMAAFDEVLNELAEKNFDVHYTLNKLDLYVIRLLLAVHREEELRLKSVKLENALTVAEEVVVKEGKNLADHKVKLDRQRDLYEQLAADDKSLERQLRKEITEAAGEYAEVVRQSFSMRPEPDNEDEWLGEAEPCPFGVEDSVWQHMLRGRETKMESESKLRGAGQTLNLLQATAQELQEEHDELERRLVSVQEAIQAHKLESELLGYDLDLVVYLKQGQLEVEQQAVVTDYTDAVMIDRQVVETLNLETRHHGGEKVEILQEIKEFRKGIHKLQWDNRCLDLEEEELVHRIRDLQLLRVTKNLQALIKGGEQTRAAQETANLERLMAYAHQLHSDKVADNKRVLDRLEAQARETLRENEELDDDVQALESAVVERDRLCELHGAAVDSAQGRNKTNMRVVVTHRKLLDLAHAQAQTREIELMREELVRLRARTFPSFAQLQEPIQLPD